MGAPRYPSGPRPGVRMQGIGNDFNGVSVQLMQQHFEKTLIFDLFL